MSNTSSPASTITARTAPVAGVKRPRELSDEPSPIEGGPFTQPSPPASAASSISSSFRNVSACNRCRLRKNRCDQRLPACASCEKAGVKCVGYDPITKREIPRSYVYFLETRVSYLETLLQNNGIPYAPAQAFESDNAQGAGLNGTSALSEEKPTNTDGAARRAIGPAAGRELPEDGWRRPQNDADKLNKLVSNIGMVSVQGASDPRYLGSTSGISFARVVFAAVKSSVTGASSERGSIRPSTAASGGPTMRDSFFGLHTKPTIKPAPFPDKDLGVKLVSLYFEHANPQIPILHRGEFMSLFNRAYSIDEKLRTPRELYILNIVFAIGAAIIWGSSDREESPDPSTSSSQAKSSPGPGDGKNPLSSQQHQPEEYHASAIVHLESFLGSSPAADRPDGFGGGLEELQAVLLLASFALLRPVAPGLWYISGVAVRLAVDLGLHYEDGVEIEAAAAAELGQRIKQEGLNEASAMPPHAPKVDAKEVGRREWVRDLRRRLWWCVYSFDRLVSTCVGRPFGITDLVITTEFPSLLDDDYITPEGFLSPPNNSIVPSYKLVSHHYIRLRLLQSEILQVLQYQQAKIARAHGVNKHNKYMPKHLVSPWLHRFNSFRAWRADIDHRLLEWKESSPRQEDIGVRFPVQFLELNYWQAVIMLYRHSLSVPHTLAEELGPTDDVSSPSMINVEEKEDEERVYLKVAEAGQKVLRIYRQLHRVRLVNYTFLATHHLFMAGLSFLYAIWHSALVRSKLTMDEVDFTILSATSVLTDLTQKCPPAEACRDAFDRMSKATVQMCLSTTGFGSQASGLDSRRTVPSAYQPPPYQSRENMAPPLNTNIENNSNRNGQQKVAPNNPAVQSSVRPPPRFDMNLGDLFPEESSAHGRGYEQGQNARNPPPASRWWPRQEGSISPLGNPKSIASSSSSPQVIAAVPASSAAQNTLYNAVPGGHRRVPASADPNMQAHFAQVQAQARGTQSQGQPLTAENVYGHSILADPSFQAFDFIDNGVGNTGIDFGFGMGMDLDHDWSDGSQFDLFDGFFFGGPTTSSGL
ncbi:hypothetical protein L228DRAFT_265560 [Xylona heveae TC161]|uniref:Zn(2)-C6 fungal-type domain-containing protein n=1 Tax=Xylona heveae (strain CBS 132557 / TC161) TaxID=1328760 RepID=A0A165ILP8_XYLHT|nr:hypothetical protein L228DRAFT_265560 [Xylona heveae TC161]KZF25076.1 hypothetical protein L228DRAFT_265560 [Xylona heveae TC161]